MEWLGSRACAEEPECLSYELINGAADENISRHASNLEDKGRPDGIIAGHILNLTQKRGRSGPAVEKRIERSDAPTTKVSCHRSLHHGCGPSSRAGPKQGRGWPQH